MALRTDKNLRAGLYARVSTEDRGQDPETQLRPLREYESWLGLSGQVFRLDRWSACRVQAAAVCGGRMK